jgi:hypothetical protein
MGGSAMRTREHMLIITMLAKQTQLIRTLFEILKSRELIEGDDVDAFEAFLLSDPASTERVLETTKDRYLKAAKSLGVVIRGT